MGEIAQVESFGRKLSDKAVPVAVILFIALIFWYVLAIPLNAVVAEPRLSAVQGDWWTRLNISWNLDRPVLPAPHQIISELWRSTVLTSPWSVKSLLYHASITLLSTLLGFISGTLLGIFLAILIVRVSLLNKSLMPWIIASQTVPIIAIAPMVIGVLGSLGITGLIPKSLISMYLCFFPVTISMVKGLTSPESIQLDLMRTYHASSAQVLWKLRFPAALPYLFASLKVAIAIALTGAIVGELPTGAQGGLGARMLAGSYYGQTIQIWSALFMASAVAALLVYAIDLIEKNVARQRGGRP